MQQSGGQRHLRRVPGGAWPGGGVPAAADAAAHQGGPIGQPPDDSGPACPSSGPEPDAVGEGGGERLQRGAAGGGGVAAPGHHTDGVHPVLRVGDPGHVPAGGAGQRRGAEHGDPLVFAAALLDGEAPGGGCGGAGDDDGGGGGRLHHPVGLQAEPPAAPAGADAAVRLLLPHVGELAADPIGGLLGAHPPLHRHLGHGGQQLREQGGGGDMQRHGVWVALRAVQHRGIPWVLQEGGRELPGHGLIWALGREGGGDGPDDHHPVCGAPEPVAAAAHVRARGVPGRTGAVPLRGEHPAGVPAQPGHAQPELHPADAGGRAGRPDQPGGAVERGQRVDHARGHGGADLHIGDPLHLLRGLHLHQGLHGPGRVQRAEAGRRLHAGGHPGARRVARLLPALRGHGQRADHGLPLQPAGRVDGGCRHRAAHPAGGAVPDAAGPGREGRGQPHGEDALRAGAHRLLRRLLHLAQRLAGRGDRAVGADDGRGALHLAAHGEERHADGAGDRLPHALRDADLGDVHRAVLGAGAAAGIEASAGIVAGGRAGHKSRRQGGPGQTARGRARG
eukprot:768787-Hanusia_phi.AAC.3